MATSFNALPREFWYFLSARLSYTLGIRMITTIVVYQVYKLANTFMVGVAGLAEFLPAVAVALYAGYFIDKNDKRKVLQTAYIAYLAIALSLVAIAFAKLENNTTLFLVLACVFCTGVVRSFASPAQNSMLAAIVPKPFLQQAVSINSSVYLIAAISGHAFGGILIAVLGIAKSYIFCSVLLALAFGFSQFILPKPPVSLQKKETAIVAIKKGLSFVKNSPNLLAVITLDLFAVLLGGVTAFIPEIAEKVLHASPIGYGFLNAAMDIGALISIMVLFVSPMKKQQGKKMLIAVAGFGLFVIVFGFSTNYALSFTALVLAGICDGISVVVRGMVQQLYTPDDLRGRVSAINMIFINSSNELGQFESGLTSKLFGTIPAIIVGGSLSLVVVLVTWLKFPTLKKIEYNNET
jgi:MFS family permease